MDISVFTGCLQFLLTKLQFQISPDILEIQKEIQASSVTHICVTEVTWGMCHPNSSD